MSDAAYLRAQGAWEPGVDGKTWTYGDAWYKLPAWAVAFTKLADAGGSGLILARTCLRLLNAVPEGDA